MARYRVFIERVERYSHMVAVDADSEKEAERKVQAMDVSNTFEDVWNELQPGVETTYEAEKID